jgi:peptidoglycan hydrolase-like protein with peptidoglycan-binding domain
MAAASAVGAAISRNPTLVAGSTAFLVALSFVSANALWYQPFAHPGAFFSTRDVEHGEALPTLNETTIRIERPEPRPVRKIEGDPVTKSVQAVLKELNLYQGTVDGLSGPATRKAVEAYQRTVGLPATGAIDQKLLDQLDTNPTAGIRPEPRPQPKPKPQSIEAIIEEPLSARFDGEDNSVGGRIRKIQAALKQSGRDDVEIDGLLGERTRSAITEFQAKHGLPQTGEADQAVLAVMRREGLID